jgi:hypothetical protein
MDAIEVAAAGKAAQERRPGVFLRSNRESRCPALARSPHVHVSQILEIFWIPDSVFWALGHVTKVNDG